MTSSAVSPGDDWMISVDDHLIEPPNVWIDRLPARLRERGPRWVADDQGEAWLVDDETRVSISGAVTAGAFWPMETKPAPFDPLTWAEVPPACYEPAARVEAMDRDHVLASMPFPNLPGFAGRLFQALPDKELALLCIRAYNDWVLDEYAAALPGRIIGLALVPMWDGALAAAEAERAIGKGARAVSFSMSPETIGLPRIDDPHWDPLLGLMNETGLPLCTHLGSGRPGHEHVADGRARATRDGTDPHPVDPHTAEVRPGAVVLQMLIDGQVCLVDWLDSGNFDRYPNLKVALSENGIGWIPAVLQAADWSMQMRRNSVTQPDEPENDPVFTAAQRDAARQVVASRADRARRTALPSEVFRAHVYGCFIEDQLGLRLLDVLGEDNVMIETDFPHISSVWPNSMARANDALADVEPHVRDKVLRGNAERAFQFVALEPPAFAGVH
jgi:predicted TIM-barrel fold metal-dependent hydrolase